MLCSYEKTIKDFVNVDGVKNINTRKFTYEIALHQFG